MRVRELSVFLPCYEEEGNVAAHRRACGRRAARADLERFEIIVVNDGSRDRTGPIGRHAGRGDQKCASRTTSRTRGTAPRCDRFAEAKFPWVFFTDGDGQFDLAEIDGSSPRPTTSRS